MSTIFTIGDKVWTTKDGTKIKYRDLSVEHIKNIAKKTFYARMCDVDEIGKPLYYDVDEVSYAEDMQLELLRRAVCDALQINL